MSNQISCPSCAAPVFPDDFMCSNCDLILNPTAASGAYRIKEPTIVRALLSIAPAASAQGAGAPTDRPAYPKAERDLTVRVAAPMDMNTYPRVSADLDIALAPLHAFEAYVVSFLSGAQPVPEVAKAAKLKQVELEAVLRSLVERNVISLEHRLPEAREEKPAPAAAPAAPVEAKPVPSVFTQPTPKPPRPAKPSRAGEAVGSAQAAGVAPGAADREAGAAPAPGAAALPAVRSAPTPASAAAASAPSQATAPTPSVVVGGEAEAAHAAPAPASAPSDPAAAIPPVLVTGPAAPPAAQAPANPSGRALAARPAAAAAPRQDARPPSGFRQVVEAPRPAGPMGSGEGAPAPAAESRGFKVIPLSAVSAVPAHAAEAPPIHVGRARSPAPAPVERPESILQKAIALERGGDVDGAIKVLERAISRFKKPAPLYNKLAVIVLNQRQDYSRSEELLKKALEHEPDNAVYQQNLFKVVALAASSDNKDKGGGFFSRLRRRK